MRDRAPLPRSASHGSRDGETGWGTPIAALSFREWARVRGYEAIDDA
jgi:hypothetical protein